MADEIDGVAENTKQAADGGREQAASATPEPQPAAGGEGTPNDGLQNNLLKVARRLTRRSSRKALPRLMWTSKSRKA